jgi:tetratricopeptide (TPR) repeat protein
LAHLGLVHHYLGESQIALRYCQQALRIAQEIGARLNQAQALTCLGHVLAGLGHLDEAADIYRQAMGLRCELGQPHLVLDSQAGLARVLLVQGELLQAQAEVERILDYLATKGSATCLETGVAGVDDPGQIFLTCYRVLQANQDSRAKAVLRAAHQHLQERALRMGDETQQRLFWEQVTAHQEIAKAYSKP